MAQQENNPDNGNKPQGQEKQQENTGSHLNQGTNKDQLNRENDKDNTDRITNGGQSGTTGNTGMQSEHAGNFGSSSTRSTPEMHNQGLQQTTGHQSADSSTNPSTTQPTGANQSHAGNDTRSAQTNMGSEGATKGGSYTQGTGQSGSMKQGAQTGSEVGGDEENTENKTPGDRALGGQQSAQGGTNWTSEVDNELGQNKSHDASRDKGADRDTQGEGRTKGL